MLKKIVNRVTDWKHWPFSVFYFPLFFAWAWYCIKSRSMWFFSTSNPSLTFGGFEGETKSEMYDQLQKELYPHTIYITPLIVFSDVVQQIKEHRFNYPFIVKPDIGMKGILFRKIDNKEHLETYHRNMPVKYIVQELIEMPIEVSVFYFRYPNSEQGCITALIQKNLLQVKGDGCSTLMQLILEHPITNSWFREMKNQHDVVFQKILPQGETFYLSYIGNRYHGAQFINLNKEVNKKLLAVFDSISHKSKFYYGRYDIKCFSIEEMKEGINFSILEFNGAGSIPNHIYAGGYTLFQAYKEIVRHWEILYDISCYNHKKGISYWSFLKGYRFLKIAKKNFRILEQLNKKIP